MCWELNSGWGSNYSWWIPRGEGLFFLFLSFSFLFPEVIYVSIIWNVLLGGKNLFFPQKEEKSIFTKAMGLRIDC